MRELKKVKKLENDKGWLISALLKSKLWNSNLNCTY